MNLGSLIAGGWRNFIPSNVPQAYIGGGNGNKATGAKATLGGGEWNKASGVGSYVGGGFGNVASNSATNLSVLGGCTTVAGGYYNLAAESLATVGGGSGNMAGAFGATVSGGYGNRATTNLATASGGAMNTASGLYATVPGGFNNTAAHQGSFVWGDGTTNTASRGANTFTVRASGGVTFFTSNRTNAGVSLAAGAGSWTSLSDRNSKENFSRVDAAEILAKVATLPVMTWNYKTQAEDIRHIGPTAQDFRKAFGVGESETGITTVDADGVALAAIQGLMEELQEQNQAIAKRDREMETLKAELRRLRMQLDSMSPPAGQ